MFHELIRDFGSIESPANPGYVLQAGKDGQDAWSNRSFCVVNRWDGIVTQKWHARRLFPDPSRVMAR